MLQLQTTDNTRAWTWQLAMETTNYWKAKGNEQFVLKNWKAAIGFYSTGLDLDPNNLNLLSNRSITYLHLRFFYRALDDSENILRIDPHYKKGIYRKIKALFGLARYSQAIAFIENDETNDQFPELKAKAKFLLGQQKRGEYDIVTLLETLHSDETMSKINFDEDIADGYISTQVELCPDVGSGKGRGVLAKDNIKAGSLIVACKAFMLSSNDYECLSVGGTPKLITDLVEALVNEPERRRELYVMYAGDKFGMNDDVGDGIPEISVERIEAICDLNRFATYELRKEFGSESTAPKCGIWIYPAYFNSDCVDRNCSHEIIGDFMFLRVIKDVEKGQELLISYKNFEDVVRPQRNYLCKCRLCIAESKEPSNVRLNLDMELRNAESTFNFAKIRKLIVNRIKSSPSPELSLYLIPWLFKLSSWESLHKDLKFANEAYQHVLEILKASNCSSSESVYACLNLASYNIQVEDLQEAAKWTKELRKECIIHFGTIEIMRIYGKATLELLKKVGLSHLLFN